MKKNPNTISINKHQHDIIHLFSPISRCSDTIVINRYDAITISRDNFIAIVIDNDRNVST